VPENFNFTVCFPTVQVSLKPIQEYAINSIKLNFFLTRVCDSQSQTQLSGHRKQLRHICDYFECFR
jgi:hypothetical protein